MLRSVSGLFGLRTCSMVLGLFNGIILARLLGPANFGAYSVALSLVNFFATLALLGIPMLATRDIAVDAERERWNRLRGLMRASERWVMFAVLVILGVFSILATAIAFDYAVTWIEVLIFAALVASVSFGQLRASFLRGLNKVVLADVPELFVRPVVGFILLAAIYVAIGYASVTLALGVQITASGIALVFISRWLVAKQPSALKTALPKELEVRWLMGALPFLAIGVITTLQGQLSLYILAYSSGSEQAGVFQAASQFTTVISVGLVSVNIPMQPRLSVAWAKNDKIELQRLLTIAARISTGFAILAVLGLLVFAEPILLLYGVEYAEGANALRILAIGQLFNAMAGACGVLLSMTGNQVIVMRGTLIALVANALVGILLIPQLESVGAAIAVAIAIATWNILFAAYALTKLGLNTTVFRL